MNKNDIIPEISIHEIDEHTQSGVYNVEGFGIQFVEQLHYTVNNEPVHRTNLRSVINVELLQSHMKRLTKAEEERDYYMRRAAELRGLLNANNQEPNVNGLPNQSWGHGNRGESNE